MKRILAELNDSLRHYVVSVDDGDSDNVFDANERIVVESRLHATPNGALQAVTSNDEKWHVLLYLGVPLDAQGQVPVRTGGSISSLGTYMRHFERVQSSARDVEDSLSALNANSFDKEFSQLASEAAQAPVATAAAINEIRRTRAEMLLARATGEVDPQNSGMNLVFARRLIDKALQLARDGGFENDPSFQSQIPTLPTRVPRHVRPLRPALDI